MDCQWADSLISRYSDGDLTDDELERLEAHTQGCLRCQRELNVQVALRDELVRLPRFVPPAQLRRKIQEACHQVPTRDALGCDGAAALLWALADSELSGGQAGEVVAHISACQQCWAEWVEVEKYRALFSALLPVKPPASLKPAIFARLRQAGTNSWWERILTQVRAAFRTPVRTAVTGVSWAVATAIALLLVGFTLFTLWRLSAPEPVEKLPTVVSAPTTPLPTQPKLIGKTTPAKPGVSKVMGAKEKALAERSPKPSIKIEIEVGVSNRRAARIAHETPNTKPRPERGRRDETRKIEVTGVTVQARYREKREKEKEVEIAPIAGAKIAAVTTASEPVRGSNVLTVSVPHEPGLTQLPGDAIISNWIAMRKEGAPGKSPGVAGELKRASSPTPHTEIAIVRGKRILPIGIDDDGVGAEGFGVAGVVAGGLEEGSEMEVPLREKMGIALRRGSGRSSSSGGVGATWATGSEAMFELSQLSGLALKPGLQEQEEKARRSYSQWGNFRDLNLIREGRIDSYQARMFALKVWQVGVAW